MFDASLILHVVRSTLVWPMMKTSCYCWKRSRIVSTRCVILLTVAFLVVTSSKCPLYLENHAVNVSVRNSENEQIDVSLSLNRKTPLHVLYLPLTFFNIKFLRQTKWWTASRLNIFRIEERCFIKFQTDLSDGGRGFWRPLQKVKKHMKIRIRTFGFHSASKVVEIMGKKDIELLYHVIKLCL